ncbi:hypothetical protein PC118_g4127 [Phytophthora cactorum]|uniref:Major facilitator superfamily domain n=1 Tax=Phytophthora cactorum TaxID=29920 RepID=A0A8T1GBJ5_9STRA|nr:hypothetical protein PC114_g5219 [Phytophthora cactorum]KAG2937662.1 hypothetical protein PC115_g4079 [Phytophthora cactorum]KAG2993222.1 hypothetical protein PC118_g4127 [Phytophthora cactorum]KAG3036103.1 hypothetical protein PC119_g4316 [Phytophthora cactorum]
MPSTLPWVYLERQQQFRGPPLARWAVSIGTTLFLIGHIVTALGIHYKAIAGIYIGYGIITAIGLGMCYTSPMSTLQKWFPDYRGTAAGFAVAGSGAGSVVWSKAYLPTIDAVGLLWMFVLLGAVMGAAIFASALVLRVLPRDFSIHGLNIDGNVANVSEGMEEKLSTAYKAVQTPTGADKPETVAAPKSPIKPLTLKQAVFTPDYIFMYLMFFANQLFGVPLVHVFNCCGRLAFSAISDFLVHYFKMEKTYARKVLYYFTLGAQIIVIGSLPTVIRHESFTFFVIEIFVLTCSYGGGLGTIPALVTDMFGAYNVIFVIVCIGFVVLFLVRTNAKDRFEPGYHYSLCGKRVISIPPKEKDAMNQQEAEEAAAEKLPETADSSLRSLRTTVHACHERVIPATKKTKATRSREAPNAYDIAELRRVSNRYAGRSRRQLEYVGQRCKHKGSTKAGPRESATVETFRRPLSKMF